MNEYFSRAALGWTCGLVSRRVKTADDSRPASRSASSFRSTHVRAGDAGKLHAAADLGELASLDVGSDLLEDTGGDGTRVAGVGVENLDDLLDGDGGLSDAPGVVVGRGTDEGVAGV